MPTLKDAFSPEGWNMSPNVAEGADPESLIRGVWSKSLRQGEPNRIVSLVYFEAGAMYPLHHHFHPQQILMLEGDAEDEIYWPDGRREVVSMKKGDWVDYPEILDHQVYSRNGCLMAIGI